MDTSTQERGRVIFQITEIGERIIGANQSSKKAHLNYGSILIRLYPNRIIMHENPLKFLEASTQYSIIFENQSKQERS